MNLKEEFVLLVKTAKNNVRKRGGRLTNAQIGEKLSVGGTYISGLLGGSKEVTKKHLQDFKSHFGRELLESTGIAPGDKLNPERAIMLALLEDYAEWKADCTDQSFDEVKASIKKRGGRILGGLDSWLPENE